MLLDFLNVTTLLLSFREKVAYHNTKIKSKVHRHFMLKFSTLVATAAAADFFAYGIKFWVFMKRESALLHS